MQNNRVVVTSVYGVLFLLVINYWAISVRARRDILLYQSLKECFVKYLIVALNWSHMINILQQYSKFDNGTECEDNNEGKHLKICSKNLSTVSETL